MVITLFSNESSCSYTNLPSLMVCYDASSNYLSRIGSSDYHVDEKSLH